MVIGSDSIGADDGLVLAQGEVLPAEDVPIVRDDADTPELSELADPATILELIGEAFAELRWWWRVPTSSRRGRACARSGGRP